MPPTQIILAVVNERKLLSIPSQSPSSIKTLLAACWARDPTLRPSMQTIEADFPEQKERGIPYAGAAQNEPRAAAFNQGLPASGYTLSSQWTLSAATTSSARTSREVRGFRV